MKIILNNISRQVTWDDRHHLFEGNMKKIKNESQLLQHAITLGVGYAAKRGYAGINSATAMKDKQEMIYRLLVLDKLIMPLAKEDETTGNIRHKLVLWIMKHLPENHSLLQ